MNRFSARLRRRYSRTPVRSVRILDTNSVQSYHLSVYDNEAPSGAREETEMTRTIAAAQFKEKCLAILDQVDPDGIVITKHGRPVAKLIPVARTSEHLIGSLQGRIRVMGDIMSTGVKWNAES